jgi:uncharacterized protein (TIGR00369 family)
MRPHAPGATPDAINAFLTQAFPHAAPPTVLAADGKSARLQMAFHQSQVRPGDTVSGPTMMALADTAAYALVLSAIGLQPMAVTANLAIFFLRRAGPNALTAQARMLKLGRTLAVCDVLITADGADAPCAHATVTYALPMGDGKPMAATP